MAQRESNVGEYGVESIRLDGMRIEHLPLGRGEVAKSQIPLALDVERQNAISDVLARFPKISKDQISARLREANDNIERFKAEISSMKTKIKAYRVHIKECDGLRPPSEVELDVQVIQKSEASFEDKLAAIKEAKADMAPWDVDGLEQQIERFEESIERFEEGIENEHRSIAQLHRTLSAVNIRDLELKKLGASIAA